MVAGMHAFPVTNMTGVRLSTSSPFASGANTPARTPSVASVEGTTPATTAENKKAKKSFVKAVWSKIGTSGAGSYAAREQVDRLRYFN
ncbi:hypothetical protein ANO11243_089820 [Dothideomycetidae sp. 11243]|nr:hypothetical protein ANO11243_089820 [fungal sp. No.11243]